MISVSYMKSWKSMTNNLIFEPLMHSICSFLFAIIILLLVFSLAWSLFIIRCIQVVHFYLLLYNLIACFLSYVIVEILCWFVLFSADFYLLDPVSINYYYYYLTVQGFQNWLCYCSSSITKKMTTIRSLWNR